MSLLLAPPVAMVEAATLEPPVWFVVLVLVALIGGVGAFIDYLLEGIGALVRVVRRINERDRRSVVGPAADRSVSM